MRAMVAGFIAMATSACGASTHPGQVGTGGKCPDNVTGSWTGITWTDHLTIASDDTFAYAGVDGCTSHGTVGCSDPTIASGTMTVSVEESTGGGCLQQGTYSCPYSVTGNLFSYTCGGMGARQYRK